MTQLGQTVGGAGEDPTAVKYIAYDAGGKAMAALLSGEIAALSTGFSEAVDLAEAGALGAQADVGGEHQLGDGYRGDADVVYTPPERGLVEGPERGLHDVRPGRPGTHMVEWYLEFATHLGLPRPRTLHRLPRDEAAEQAKIVETATFAATAATLWWFGDRGAQRTPR